MLRFAAVPFVVAFALLAACGGSGGDASGRTTIHSAAQPPTAPAQAAAVHLVRVGTFDSPTYVTSPPHDTRRLMVVQQGGRIMVVRGGKLLARPFLDLTSRVVSGGEQGLLSMAFARDY
ncbi:MAG: glucose/sorbosone dehydrogenase-like protein, partial [Actinomycetia bacterium]|nr:glucose/sorbosone dehydrogenase-like protein [Actinomycetes bacterium]